MATAIAIFDSRENFLKEKYKGLFALYTHGSGLYFEYWRALSDKRADGTKSVLAINQKPIIEWFKE